MYKSARIFITIFCTLIFAFATKANNPVILNMNEGWIFTCENYNKPYPAKVPGSIHTDLFNNNLIADPFKSDNEKHLQWIDTIEWTYTKHFLKPENLTNNHNVEIVFMGLDTYADIYLNNSLLASSDNMFIPKVISIKLADLKKNNILTIKFKPAIREEQKIYSSLPYKLPEGSRACTRKAAYHYGWDWGPKYVTAGIWQNIELHIWETAKIKHITYFTEKLNSSEAIINFRIKISSDSDFIGTLELKEKNQKYIFNDIDIKKGLQTYNIKATINNPILWWTHNYGNPYLYNFNISLQNKNIELDSKNTNIGIRQIELVQEKDELGKSFYFKLNGVPVFMKGANYIPQSSFPGVVSDNEYTKIISDAKKANMNMLRVWGGGIYEKDIFYDLCDKEGILIWQDFMFANNMFPSDSSFINNVIKEASYQTEQLSKHPCIAIWCGNNEIDEAWHNWGWSNNYSIKDSTELWDNYKKIFHQLLPEIVNENSPNISYTSSSPLFGRGNPRSSFEGDNHYWYVWHDAYDFDWYNKVTGRFMSEFGFQSFPSIETIEYFDTSAYKEINSSIMHAHQKHHRGNFLINHYMKDYFPIPENFEDFIYISQLLQAEGIRTGILAQRRAKPFCMGSLYWQLNDCWPAISWSSIDYSGNWKALHYLAQQDFKNLIISPAIENDSINLYVISDSLTNFKGELKITLMDFNGTIKYNQSVDVNNIKNESKLVYTNHIKNILQNNDPNGHLIYVELTQNKQLIDSRTVLFTKAKNLHLSKSNFQVKINLVSESYELIFTTTNYIKSLFIEPEMDGFLSDNYFDLIPGIEKRITFITNKKIETPTKYFNYKTINQFVINK